MKYIALLIIAAAVAYYFLVYKKAQTAAEPIVPAPSTTAPNALADGVTGNNMPAINISKPVIVNATAQMALPARNTAQLPIQNSPATPITQSNISSYLSSENVRKLLAVGLTSDEIVSYVNKGTRDSNVNLLINQIKDNNLVISKLAAIGISKTKATAYINSGTNVGNVDALIKKIKEANLVSQMLNSQSLNATRG